MTWMRLLHVVWLLLLATLFAACEDRTRQGSTIQLDQGVTTNVLAGRVFDQVTGRELSGATVRVLQQPTAAVSVSAVTTAPGRFLIAGIASGSARLEVERSGFNSHIRGIVFPHRGRLDMDVGLMPATFFGTLTGLVLDAETGDPLPGVIVTVPQQRSTVPLPGGPPAPVGTVVTGADGRFTVGPVGAGRVTVRFELPTHQTTDFEVDVPANGTVNITFRLQLNTGTLTGTVFSDRDGQPLPGATVAIPALEISTLTDSAGRYRFAPLVAGSYALEVTAPAHDRREVVAAVFTGRTNAVDITLRFNLARLSGIVRDSAGSPLPGATVSVPAIARTTRTGADGRYDFGLTLRVPDPALPLGIGATAQGFAPGTAFVTLTPGQEFVQDFQLFRSTGNLVGTVISQLNGLPVPSAIVSIPALNQSRITNLTGSYTFFAIPAQSHQVDVFAAGLSRLTTFVPVFEGRTTVANLVLSP
jgi:hypothetical protein